MTAGLPASLLVNVTINLSPALAPAPNIQSMLILGSSGVIDTVTRIEEYAGLEEVGVAFGTTAPEYLAAKLWFGQSPSPESVLIGEWAKNNTSGQLFCGTTANNVVADWVAINNGSFNCSVDGVPQAVGNLNFGAQTTMNGVAAEITSGFPGGVAVVTWDSANNRFVITSDSTGAASAVTFLTPGLIGTDISGLMAGLSTSPGAYEAPGLAAETLLACVTLFDNEFPGQWYGLAATGEAPADDLAVAQFIEADALNHHTFWVTSQDPNCEVASSTTDIMYQLEQLGITRTYVQYSNAQTGSPYAAISAAARLLTTNWNANNSTITLMYKNEPLVAPEFPSVTQLNAVLAKNGNLFVQYNNGTAIIQPGITPSGQYMDTVVGCDFLQGDIQTDVFDLLYGSNKVPQTDAGMHQIATTISAACADSVNNGLGAPGVWTAQGFGQLVTGQTLANGYYVYAPPIASQSASQRSQRMSVPFQVAFKLAGAVQTVDVTVNVNT